MHDVLIVNTIIEGVLLQIALLQHKMIVTPPLQLAVSPLYVLLVRAFLSLPVLLVSFYTIAQHFLCLTTHREEMNMQQ